MRPSIGILLKNCKKLDLNSSPTCLKGPPSRKLLLLHGIARGWLDLGNRARELSVSVPRSKTWLSMLAQSKADRLGLDLVESLDAAQISSNGENGDGDLD